LCRCLSRRRLAWREVIRISEGDITCFATSKDTHPLLSTSSHKRLAFEVCGKQILLGKGSQQVTRTHPEGHQPAARAATDTLASLKTEPGPRAIAQPPVKQNQGCKRAMVVVLDSGSNEEDDDIEIEVDVGSPRHYQPRSPAQKKGPFGANHALSLVPFLACKLCRM
jgi:hypothetical protein